MVEFADFGCEFCRIFYLRTFGAQSAEVWRAILDEELATPAGG